LGQDPIGTPVESAALSGGRAAALLNKNGPQPKQFA